MNAISTSLDNTCTVNHTTDTDTLLLTNKLSSSSQQHPTYHYNNSPLYHGDEDNDSVNNSYSNSSMDRDIDGESHMTNESSSDLDMSDGNLSHTHIVIHDNNISHSNNHTDADTDTDRDEKWNTIITTTFILMIQ